ncbi:hypothetical protein UK23_34220 [Lentzea aerocolonigenes]|uniref:Adaptor protein ClpS core domain-containing protein n=1 Tax=Lentzea aerocolonigenes TaxID=68170 RepID=A0A0F0GKW6_LENAE|nr:hypothetical protein UK23_34220 [Lentzea aerocolonigenes]
MHNDDHTPFAVACHLLRTVCGFDVEKARGLTAAIHQSGSVAVGSYDRATAESITLRLVRAGLRAELRQEVYDTQEVFSAERVGDGVLVKVPEVFARGWEPAFESLDRLYRVGSTARGLRWPRPVMTRRPLLRKMFPDTSASRWQSAMFRRRHRKVLADRALVNRVWEQWINAESRTLTLDEAGEWIVVFGQIRALYLLVRKATPLQFHTLAYLQEKLVQAVDPEAFAGPDVQPAVVEQPT